MHKPLTRVLIVGTMLLAGGCGDDDANQTGTLELRIVDTPYPFEMITSASLTIDAVEVRVAGAGFQTLAVPDSLNPLNLLELQNGVSELLVETEVPVGSIDQIRLIVRSASVSLDDGRTFELDIPSGESSGLKLFVDPPIEVVADLTTELVLDVDVSESFKPVPNAATHAADVDHFQFHPVLRVANVSTTGTVSGHVLFNAGTPGDPFDDTPIAGATVTASVGGVDVATTGTEALGAFVIPGLPAGNCVVTAEALGFVTDELPVVVVAANNVSLDFRLGTAP